MRKYTVKEGVADEIVFKLGRSTKATVSFETSVNGLYHCYMPITRHGGLGADYESFRDCLSHTLDYLESLDFNNEATFNGKTKDEFISYAMETLGG